MKRFCVAIAAVSLFSAFALAQRTSVPTSFSYQGRLEVSGSPYTGDADVTFRLYSAETGGSAAATAGPIQDVPVTEGVFTVDVDFGIAGLAQDADWLEIDIAPSGQAPVTLSPRVRLGSAPLAVQAAGVVVSQGNTVIRSGTGVVASNSALGGLGDNVTTVWQSFRTGGIDGRLSSAYFEIATILFSNVNGITMEIYEGEGTSGQLLASEVFNAAEFSSIVGTGFESGPVLEASTTYTVAISSPLLLEIAHEAGNPYTSGRSSFAADDDLGFSVSVTSTEFAAVFVDDRDTLRVDSDLSINSGRFPVARLTVDGEELSNAETNNDDIAVAGTAGILGLYGTSFSGQPAALTLARTDGSGLVGKWGLYYGSPAESGDLRLTYGSDRIFDSNPTIMTATQAGDVGIGTTSPIGRLGIRAPAETDCTLSLRTGASYVLRITQKPDSTFVITNNGDRVFLESNGRLGIGVDNPGYRLELPNIASVAGQGRANAWVTYSSERYKEHIEPIDDAVDLVGKLRGVRFDWKPEHGAYPDVGFIAEEVAEVFPELVKLDGDGKAESLDYSRLVPVAIEAIKAQQATIDEQAERLGAIEKLVAELIAEHR